MMERPDREPCGICRRQISRYTCPTCNLPYCSLKCFRSEVHSDCSETFYRKEIETDIKIGAPKSAEGRNKMLAMLRNFEEESPEESYALAEDGDDLARKLEDTNLDEADPDVIWSMLSPSQRESFFKVIRDPTNELAQQLLSSVELQQERRRPWWESSLPEDESSADSNIFGVPPKMMQIPQKLIAPGVVSDSSSCLVYNIVALCLAYAYVTRRLSWSPLSALKATDSDRTVARDLLSQIAPFLTDRKSTLLFKNVDGVVTYVWSMIEALLSDAPSSESFGVLLSDGTTLLRPRPVVMISDDADSPISRLALLAISDIVELFSRGHPKLTHVLLKLKFYAAHIYVQNTDVLSIVAEEVWTARLKMQSHPLV